MKLLTTAAIALALTAGASAAMADPQNNGQNDRHDHQGGGNGGGQRGGGNGGGQPHYERPQLNAGQGGGGQQFRRVEGAQAGQQWQGGQRGQGGQQWQGRQAWQGGQPYRRAEGQPVQAWQGRGQPFNGGQGGGPQVRHFQGGVAPQQFNGGRGGQWRGSDQFGFREHGMRDRDQGRSWYDAGEFRRHEEARERFRVGFFDRPDGWYYQSWDYGMFLPYGWYAPDYYLDWADYGLPPPPIGCEWVREGPDAVLVDVWTGEVLSVYSGLFY